MTFVLEREGPDPEEGRVYARLLQFFDGYFVQRDVEQSLALCSDRIIGIGTGEDEVADGKAELRRLLKAQFTSLPGPIRYEVRGCTLRRMGPDSWDCCCRIQLDVTTPGGARGLYTVRMTVGMCREKDGYMIHMVHASEASQTQREGEFFPLKFISEGAQAVSRTTQRELLEIIEQIMPGGIVGGYAEEGFPLYVANERLLHMAGYGSYEEFEQDIGGLVINSIHPEDHAFVNRTVAKLLNRSDQYEIEYRMKRRDGSYFWVHDIGRRTVAGNGREAIISVILDISRQKDLRDRLQRDAAHDFLTGIYNRRAGQERIMQSVRDSTGYAFFMLDLDNFKRVNDIYGHEQGDVVLRHFAEQLVRTFYHTDTVCRMGGDEFVVFLPDVTDIRVVEEKINQLIDTYGELVNGSWPEAGSTLSVGGVYSRTPREFTELYRLADQALYQVKKEKKGRAKILTV